MRQINHVTENEKATEKLRYTRLPAHDRRFAHGDDFAGDAWTDTWTGAIVWAVVGYDRNSSDQSDQ